MTFKTLKHANLTGLIAVGATCSNTGAGYELMVDIETGDEALAGLGTGAKLDALDRNDEANDAAMAIGSAVADSLYPHGERKQIVIGGVRQHSHRFYR